MVDSATLLDNPHLPKSPISQKPHYSKERDLRRSLQIRRLCPLSWWAISDSPCNSAGTRYCSTSKWESTSKSMKQLGALIHQRLSTYFWRGRTLLHEFSRQEAKSLPEITRERIPAEVSPSSQQTNSIRRRTATSHNIYSIHPKGPPIFDWYMKSFWRATWRLTRFIRSIPLRDRVSYSDEAGTEKEAVNAVQLILRQTLSIFNGGWRNTCNVLKRTQAAHLERAPLEAKGNLTWNIGLHLLRSFYLHQEAEWCGDLKIFSCLNKSLYSLLQNELTAPLSCSSLRGSGRIVGIFSKHSFEADQSWACLSSVAAIMIARWQFLIDNLLNLSYRLESCFLACAGAELKGLQDNGSLKLQIKSSDWIPITCSSQGVNKWSTEK